MNATEMGEEFRLGRGRKAGSDLKLKPAADFVSAI